MSERLDDRMEVLVTAATRVLAVHEPEGEGHCSQPDCVSAALVGRCLPHRIASGVVSTWANRIHLRPARPWSPFPSATDVPERRGQVFVTPGGVKAMYYPAYSMSPMFTGARHPAWCTGVSCRRPGGQRVHIGAPDTVANVMVTLMHMEGSPPVVTLTDLTAEDSEAATVAVPVAFTGSLAQAVRLTGLHAMTAD